MDLVQFVHSFMSGLIGCDLSECAALGMRCAGLDMRCAGLGMDLHGDIILLVGSFAVSFYQWVLLV